jgi:hypothetical protein
MIMKVPGQGRDEDYEEKKREELRREDRNSHNGGTESTEKTGGIGCRCEIMMTDLEFQLSRL